MTESSSAQASFELYDLRVEVSEKSGTIIGNHKIGDYFEVRGEDIFIPEGQGFSMYAIGALLPLLAAKQRMTDPLDWMSSDEYIADPDPNCQAVYRIVRLEKRTFNRSDVTAVPLPSFT